MDINKSEDFKDESPSQRDIGSTYPMKLENLESVDDFEHIAEYISPSKEVTEQFLEYETNFISCQNVEDSQRIDDGIKNIELFSKDQDLEGLPAMNSNNWEHESLLLKNNEGVIDPAVEDDIDMSKNFLEYEKLHDKIEDNPTPLVEELEKNNDKLIDIESSIDFDSSPVKASDCILSNNSEILMPNSVIDSKTVTSTIASQSLPGIIKPQNDSKVHSESKPQGDGLHLSQTVGLDASDAEEHIPEPVPKDYPEIGVFEPKDFLSALGMDNWFRPERLNPRVESLIYWRDVKKSGIVFGCGLTTLLSLCYYSLISVSAYSSLIVLTVALSFRIYKSVLQAVQKTTEGHPFKDLLAVDLTVNPEKTKEFLETVVKYLNSGLIELRRLFLVEDIVDSIKFGVLLWAMTYVGSWFNGLSLIIIGFVALFTLPKVYENNKAQIDANLDIVKAKINEVAEKVKAVIPVGRREDEVKSKDE